MESPCIKICKLNEKSVCIGCGRTNKQIKEWITYTDSQRDEIIKSLKYYTTKIYDY